MAGGPEWVRCGIGVFTDSKFLIGGCSSRAGGSARIVMKADNAESCMEGPWSWKRKYSDMSADELEQLTLWQRPEVGYHQTLNKKKLRAAFCLVMACENPVPHAK